jgi:putative exporter of polyketide antibiotics
VLAGWTAGFAALGAVFGALTGGIGDLQRDNPTLQDIFARMGGRAGLIDTVQLDQRLLDLSPFTHVPKAPGAAVAAAPLVWLAAVAVALAAAGLVGLRRRDMPATS